MNTVTRYCWFGSVIAAAAMIAACGGGAGGSGGSGISPSVQLGHAANAQAPQVMSDLDKTKHKKKGEVKIVVKIPPNRWKLTPLPFGKHRQGKVRHPKYVSPSTQSMTVAVAGQPTQIFDLTPTSPDCSTNTDTGYLTCSESGFFPSGRQTITVTMYDQQNGQGDALSTATTSATIVAGAVTYISITLDGVVASATVLLNGGLSASVPKGVATNLPLIVNAYDAKGNLIVSPGQYDASTPVTLTDSDTSGTTSLSSSSVSGPGNSLTLSYNGGNISSAIITAKVSGAASGSATLTVGATPTPAPVASPASLNFNTAATQTFSVQESTYTGTLTATSSDTTVATVSPGSARGPNATFTVTPVGGGTCTITVTDSLGNTATVSVSVNGGVIVIDQTPVATPTSLTFDTAASQTFTIKETDYFGSFTPTGCDGVARVSLSSAGGPNATFTVTPANGGACTVTIADGQGNTATVGVSVSGGSVIIDRSSVKHTHGGK